MSSSDATLIDAGGDPPRQPSKQGKSKEPRAIMRDFTPLDDSLALLEDIMSKMGERYTEISDSFDSFNDEVCSMEESVATAMATFRNELENLQGCMTRRHEERKKLIEEFIAQVDKVEDLKTRVTILEKVVAHRHEPQIEETK